MDVPALGWPALNSALLGLVIEARRQGGEDAVKALDDGGAAPIIWQ